MRRYGQMNTSGESAITKRKTVGRTPGVFALASIPMILVTVLACSPAKEEGPSRLATPGSAVAGEIVSIVGEPLAPGVPMTEVLAHPDVFERIQRVSQILQRATPEDLDELLMAFETAPLDKGGFEYGLFGHWWARFDPEAAFIYAESLLRTDHASVILQVVRAWAASDPIGAVESKMLYGLDLRSPGIRDFLVDVFVVSWYEAELPGLEEWVVSQPDPRAIASGLRAYGRMKVLEVGPEAALEWSRTADFADADRRLLIAGMLNTIAHQYPELAVDWIEVAKEDGIDTRTFASRVARSWAHHEPEKALNWIRTQVEDDFNRKQALRQITKRWLRKDAEGMRKFLEGHVGEAWTDNLRNDSVRWYVTKNHYQIEWPLALENALASAQPASSHSLASWVMQRYFVADPDGAEAWLAKNPGRIPDDFIKRARNAGPELREKINYALAHRRDA